MPLKALSIIYVKCIVCNMIVQYFQPIMSSDLLDVEYTKNVDTAVQFVLFYLLPLDFIISF